MVQTDLGPGVGVRALLPHNTGRVSSAGLAEYAIGKLRPAPAAKAGLKPEDIATNEFVDMSIGVRA